MRSDSCDCCKNEYFEKQPVQCKLQMTEKISLKKAQYYSLYNSIDDNKFTP